MTPENLTSTWYSDGIQNNSFGFEYGKVTMKILARHFARQTCSVTRTDVFNQRLSHFVTGILVLVIMSTQAGCNVNINRAEAQKTAARIHHQFANGDFASIYRDSSEHFKQLEEKEFISSMEQIRQDYGPLQGATVIAYQSGVDTKMGVTDVIISDLEFVKAKAREKMIFSRAEDGSLLLWDLIIEPR